MAERLFGPSEAHNVNSIDEYRAFGDRLLRRQGKALHVTESEIRPVALVNHGYWQVRCECGNYPSTSPDIPIAVCCQCGEVRRPVFPPDAERAEIEAILLARPPQARNFDPSKETIAHIRWENEHRGVAV